MKTVLPMTLCFAVCGGLFPLQAEPAGVHSGKDDTAVILVFLAEKWDVTGLIQEISPRRGAPAVEESVFTVLRVEDEVLGRDVLEFRKTDAPPRGAGPLRIILRDPVDGAYAVHAMVRFPAAVEGRARTRFTLGCGTATGGEDHGQAYMLHGGTTAKGFHFSLQRGPSAVADAGENRWGASGTLEPLFDAGQISPLEVEHRRIEMEDSLARMPAPDTTWIPLRLEVRPESVRAYLKGVFVSEEPQTESAAGVVVLHVHDTMRLTGLDVHVLEDDSGSPFITVPLETHHNARGPVDLESLARPWSRLNIHDIPFSLFGATPYDHVDIAKSIYRFRLGTSYGAHFDAQRATPHPTQFDPARLMFRAPARAYRRAWVLAGAEDDPVRAPVLSIRFFRPQTGFASDTTTTVPFFTARSADGDARPVTVKNREGRDIRLWLVPVELDAAELSHDFRGRIFNIELTKEIKPHVGWPDPTNYSYQPGGLPSSVRLYGLTLEEAPVWSIATGDVHGNTYEMGETPNWLVTVRNQADRNLSVSVKIEVTDPYGKSWQEEKILRLDPAEEMQSAFSLQPELFGLHTVTTTVAAPERGGSGVLWQQSRAGKMLVVPPVRRRATGLTSPWGVWQWAGTHGTHPVAEDNARLLYLLGAINIFKPDERIDLRERYDLGPRNYRVIGRNLPAWAAQDPMDSDEYEAYKERIGQSVRAKLEETPDLRSVNCFAENSVSLRLTHGVPDWSIGRKFEYTGTEITRIRQMTATAMAGAEGVRKQAPGLQFLFGHGAGCFPLPFFEEESWDPDMFDGFGLDLPQFERMPERQPRATEPSLLYFLYKAMQEDPRLKGKEIVHLESYFPSSHELALGHRKQADSVVRTALLSLALGTTRFEEAWTLHDCSNRWGNQHYGCAGLIARWPEFNPKPAATAFATMTRVVDMALFDGWLDTGSRSAFCLRFLDEDRAIYAVWTFHGTRPLTLYADTPSVTLVKIDEHGNEFPLPVADGVAEVELSPTPFWIVASGGGLREVNAGTPLYEENPGEYNIILDKFESADWEYDDSQYTRFTRDWDMVREPVAMTHERVPSDERDGTVWRVRMAKRPEDKPMVGFYGVFTPPEPILIPGKAAAIGVHVRGASQWHRLIYELEDAKGGKWVSCGAENWNADDIHSWSYLNFDGWRFMQFPLPANAPGDDFREHSSYSWGPSGGDGVVHLPLKLTKIIVEMRTDMIYVNEMLPLAGDDLIIEIDDLVAVYDNAENMTDQPVKLQAAARDAWRPEIEISVLPNPIAALAADGAGTAAVIEKIYPPEEMAAGDRVYVKLKTVAGAQKYTVYVAAHENGRGARDVGRPQEDHSVIFVSGLQPEIPMYFFATYTDTEGNESKPSAARKTVLKDEFPFQ